ncbi:putative reverse transcriptase domain-containing protein [Tanacetum coccineum]
MGKKISTLTERQAENKRKLDNNNQDQQQPPKKQGVTIADTARPGEKKEYAGTLPLYNKCKFHHNGQYTVKCTNCKRVGHLTRDCRSPATTNNQRNSLAINMGIKGIHDRRHLIPNPKPKSRDTPLVALGQSVIKLALQKSYTDVRRKHLEFQVDNRVMLKVSPYKGEVRFGKRGKLNPRYVEPSKVMEKVGSVAYKLEQPQELSKVHHTFHVSNLKKCYTDEPLAVPLDGLHIDDKLQFVEEPVEIMDREVKRLRQSRISNHKGSMEL